MEEKKNACEIYVDKLASELPEMCLIKDLVKFKIFGSSALAKIARETKDTPPYLQMKKKGKVLYPRDGVIKWLRGKINADYSS